MKKYLLAGTIFGLLFPFVTFASIDTNVHYGSIGADVTALQEFLTQQGLYSGPISGNFYSLTVSAVKKFQSAEGIVPVSGYVGTVTRGVINQILAGQAPNSEGNATTTKPPVDLSQQQTSTATTSHTPKTITLPNGATILLNSDGTFASYSPPSTPQSSTTLPASNTPTVSSTATSVSTPTAASTPPPVTSVTAQPVNKQLKLVLGQKGVGAGPNADQVYYSIQATYTENGGEVEGVPIIITASDGGIFQPMGPSQDIASIDTATGSAGDPRGNYHGTVILKTYRQNGGFNLLPGTNVGIFTQYIPKGQGVIITAEANGITQTAQGYDQK
jgi:hypothetical protein